MAEQFHNVTITCVQCGKEAERRYRGIGPMPLYCGNACKVRAWKSANPEAWLAARERERQRKVPSTRLCSCGAPLDPRRRVCGDCAQAKYNAELEAARQARVKHCRQCGVVVHKGAQRCAKCRDVARREARAAFLASDAGQRMKRAAKARRRAIERGVDAERFDPFEVFERDGWRCHICGARTPKAARGTCKPNAPELDHIVPLSAGGRHTRQNTACACRACNGSKGALPLGQLLLIG